MSKTLKIITLNVWGGRVLAPLKEFFENHQDIDIFCLQEVYKDAENVEINDERKKAVDSKLFSSIQEILKDYVGIFHPHRGDFWGLAMFIKKSISVLEQGDHFVFKYKNWIPEENPDFSPKNIQYIKTKFNSHDLTIINFHGLWNGKGKTDTDDRLDQSRNVKEFLDNNVGEEIFCGDFNLLPETESIKIIEDAGFRNLIKENDIQSTRTSFYTKTDKHADYIFVSSGVKVLDFKVLPDEVSDHSALYLEIE